ncbi:MAG: hypothetical protein K5799_11080 [Erythrobacter sp.]|nr:hypothetical protein [Erythrobacter sp.]
MFAMLCATATTGCAEQNPANNIAQDTAINTPGQQHPSTEKAELSSAAPPAFGLEPLAYDEFSPLIEPGLGCSFDAQSGDTIFVATAPDNPEAVAMAVIKAGTVPVLLEASDAGGYATLQSGGSFSNGMGLFVTITRNPDEGTLGEIETTSWPARLAVHSAEGLKREYAGGIYACGA